MHHLKKVVSETKDSLGKHKPCRIEIHVHCGEFQSRKAQEVFSLGGQGIILLGICRFPSGTDTP